MANILLINFFSPNLSITIFTCFFLQRIFYCIAVYNLLRRRLLRRFLRRLIRLRRRAIRRFRRLLLLLRLRRRRLYLRLTRRRLRRLLRRLDTPKQIAVINSGCCNRFMPSLRKQASKQRNCCDRISRKVSYLASYNDTNSVKNILN